MNFIVKCCKKAGPGVVTGAADVDPSGIGTYSQAGAQFGYKLVWTGLFLLPLQAAIQEACARIGAVTGRGIASEIKIHYGKSTVWFLVLLVFIANTINIGADIGAMAAATQLVLPLPFVVLTLFFTFFILGLEIYISYKKYANILKWFCLSLLAYPLTLLMIEAPWTTILKATFVPHFEFNFKFLFIFTGVLGTTISPYLFFWEASQETEEEKRKKIPKNHGKPQINKKFINELRIDNFVGMFFSQLVAWSIIVVGAAVLNSAGITDITSAADAAKALEPLVGTFATVLFTIGIVGLGLLAIPILAGSVAYAVSESFNWKKGLNVKFKSAHGFYGIIILSTGIGLLMNFLGIDPMKTLIYASVLNGIVAIPLIFFIALIANNKNIMGHYKSKMLSNTLVWLTFICMALGGVTMLISLGKG